MIQAARGGKDRMGDQPGLGILEHSLEVDSRRE